MARTSPEIVYRNTKGFPISAVENDQNFANLVAAIDASSEGAGTKHSVTRDASRRDLDLHPNDYQEGGTFFEIREASALGLTDLTGPIAVQTFQQGSSDADGGAHQFAYITGQAPRMRYGNRNDGWSAWFALTNGGGIDTAFNNFRALYGPYVGEWRGWHRATVPNDKWAFANGGSYSSAEYPEAAAIFGTGGSTFTLPDWRSRSPMMAGQGAGLTNRELGGNGGSETHVMTIPQMPSHTHTSPANSGSSSGGSAGNGTAGAFSNGSITGATGGGQPFPIVHPVFFSNFIIYIGDKQTSGGPAYNPAVGSGSGFNPSTVYGGSLSG